MAGHATYDPTSLDVPRNMLRLLLGDTDIDHAQLGDHELDAFLGPNPTLADVEPAAARVARSLQARYAREADKWVGDLKILNSQKGRNFANVAESLETKTRVVGTPSAGGIRVGQKETVEADTDLVEPYFSRNLHDYGDL